MNTILKWPGSKVRVIADLSAHLPAGNRLVEPFDGSCAVMMNTDYSEYLVADINPDLINMYRQIKEHTRPFIVVAMALFSQNTTEESYYRVRKEFNENVSMPLLERAAHFLYLNRHGYRGVCRYNLKGEFNVPFGHYAKPYYPLYEIEMFAEKAQRATFICAGYQETLSKVKSGDVVYCDPPYHGTFTEYHTGGFDEDEQHSLACYLLGISDRNPVILSNSDTLFTRSIYRAFDITKITVARSVGVKAGDKKRASEIIAIRKPNFAPVFSGFDLAAGKDCSVAVEVPQ
ncbi:Dam family site-specific DNA-(adenine-N6)-methyltransferase [Pantoea ananatis]|uniref:Dam family site-specific DNA-(adenine-N6)-methyltransferase n=1 Tax=Pantoea ananas TaxID=553 RepID=UPI000E2618F9|nr:Dam family site-specific DNA-(adenine-N6)-methyltransferase [Pantoea ananatis]REC90880.1 DNA adenine methylase Dam [Pantoea ananatis]